MSNLYDQDLVAWATSQAQLLRGRQWQGLDTAHLAEQMDAVARAEMRELASRMAMLVADLLAWQSQPGRHSNSWLRTIHNQRRRIGRLLGKAPSLAALLQDAEWAADVWEDAVDIAARETGMDEFPAHAPWAMSVVLDADFFP